MCVLCVGLKLITLSIMFVDWGCLLRASCGADHACVSGLVWGWRGWGGDVVFVVKRCSSMVSWGMASNHRLPHLNANDITTLSRGGSHQTHKQKCCDLCPAYTIYTLNLESPKIDPVMRFCGK